MRQREFRTAFFLFLHVPDDQAPEEAFKPTEVLFYVSSVLNITASRLRLVDNLVTESARARSYYSS